MSARLTELVVDCNDPKRMTSHDRRHRRSNIATVPDDGSECWSTRTLAVQHGVEKDTVRRIWKVRKLRPWLVDTFKMSTDRFLRLLPDRRFEIQRLAVSGPPWNMQLGAHVLIRSSVSTPYVNQFGHFLRLRWCRVVEDVVVEDSQRWERACTELVAAGLTEAAAPPLTPARQQVVT